MIPRETQPAWWPWILVPFLIGAALVLVGAALLEGDAAQGFQYAL